MLQPISWLSLEWLDMIILRIDLLRPLNPFLNIAEKPSIQNLGSRKDCERASLFISSQNFTNYRNFKEYIYFCLVWFSVEEGIIVFKQLPKSIGDLVCLIKGLTHHIGGLIHLCLALLHFNGGRVNLVEDLLGSKNYLST